jgi:hypothetical protein
MFIFFTNLCFIFSEKEINNKCQSFSQITMWLSVDSRHSINIQHKITVWSSKSMSRVLKHTHTWPVLWWLPADQWDKRTIFVHVFKEESHFKNYVSSLNLHFIQMSVRWHPHSFMFPNFDLIQLFPCWHPHIRRQVPQQNVKNHQSRALPFS